MTDEEMVNYAGPFPTKNGNPHGRDEAIALLNYRQKTISELRKEKDLMLEKVILAKEFLIAARICFRDETTHKIGIDLVAQAEQLLCL